MRREDERSSRLAVTLGRVQATNLRRALASAQRAGVDEQELEHAIEPLRDVGPIGIAGKPALSGSDDGVTPWSPLKSGVLSGKYTRENHGKQKADRGAWAESNLTEKTYALIDELLAVAKALETTPARVALAWVQAQPAVTSTIIGARTLEQLEQNLGALEVRLPPEGIAKLDALSKPALNFPGEFLRIAGAFMYGGLTVNGDSAMQWPYNPRADSKTY
jgi:hypothetical protein